MPKGRINSIASSGSGSGAGGSGNTGDINERLISAGTIEVEIESRTRGQVEPVQVTFGDNPGIAEVHSASGMGYTVDYMNGECTCMHQQMRGGRCRHLDSVDTALGQVVNHTNDSNSEGEVIDCRSNLDVIQDERRDEIMPDMDQQDDGFFYLDNIDEFNRKLSDGVDTPYEYNDVLNGNNVTFGIELEFVGGDANAMARELYSEGICGYPERVRYHAPSIEGKWKLERDGTVSDGSGGGELVSPVLRDTPETWRDIEKICEVASRHGARIDYRCGGHVHIGMEPLDTARQRWKRFFKVMSGYEECIYRAAGGDEGRIRSGHRNYATSFEGRARYGVQSRIQMDSESDVTRLAADVGNRNRYYGLNLSNIASQGKPDTVEFRYFNGSLNSKQIQANVKLSAGMMMAARKGRTKDIESIGYEVTDGFKRRGGLINKYDSTNARSDKKIAELMDIIFTRKQDKDALINVFSKNSWR